MVILATALVRRGDGYWGILGQTHFWLLWSHLMNRSRRNPIRVSSQTTNAVMQILKAHFMHEHCITLFLLYISDPNIAITEVKL